MPDPAKKLELQQRLMEANSALQSKAMDIEAARLEAQKSIITAEATGKDFLERDWRPILMLFLATVVGFAIFNGGFDLAGRPIPEVYVTWALKIVAIGIGGYVGGQAVQDARNPAPPTT